MFRSTLRFPFEPYRMLWLGTIGDWGFGGSAVFDKVLSPWRLATKDQQHLSHPVTSSYTYWCHPGTSNWTLPTTRHSDVQISEMALAQRAAARLESIYHTHSPSTDISPRHKRAPWPHFIQMAHRSHFIAVFVMSNGTWRRAYLSLVWTPRPLSIRMERAELHAFKMLQGDSGGRECPKAGRLLGH